MKRIYFVRHGETEGNKGKLFQFPDTPLTDLGLAQAEAAGERLRHVRLDTLIASPFKRAQQTAEAVAKATGLSIETFNDFHEHMFPEAARGQSHDHPDFAKYRKDYMTEFSKEEIDAPGFENYAAVLKRMQSCAQFLREYDAKDIVVVAHRTYLHTLTAFLLLQEKDDKETILTLHESLQLMGNAGITEFVLENDHWELATWNDCAHYAE